MGYFLFLEENVPTMKAETTMRYKVPVKKSTVATHVVRDSKLNNFKNFQGDESQIFSFSAVQRNTT